MRTYPLPGLTIEEAMRLQFRVIDCITRHFAGHEMLTGGDLGVVMGLNKPAVTARVEQVIAGIFDAEACILVRGAGSGAIRFGLHALMKPGDRILIHQAPVYNTTAISFEMLGLIPLAADFNDPGAVRSVLSEQPDLKGALIQHTRQRIDDRYNLHEVIRTMKECRDIPVLTDDNYVVMRVNAVGVQCGAELSCFSAFKLLGPEGVGIIVGRKRYIERLAAENYSGGMQIQGHEALSVLRGLTYAPVSLAIQAQVGDECVRRLKAGEIPLVKDAFLASAQSKVLLVEFREPVAEQVLEAAERLGAAPHPVGAESRYEIVPMFYRVSGAFRQTVPALEHCMIRINPMRAGAETIMRIIKDAVKCVTEG